MEPFLLIQLFNFKFKINSFLPLHQTQSSLNQHLIIIIITIFIYSQKSNLNNKAMSNNEIFLIQQYLIIKVLMENYDENFLIEMLLLMLV